MVLSIGHMIHDDMSGHVLALRSFAPAKNFEGSLHFYSELRFKPFRLGDGLASMHLGPFAFLLQDYYVEAWAHNVMMHLLVVDLDEWWRRIESLRLPDRFDVKAPAPPKREPWGLRVSYVWDPSGVLWHFAEDQATHKGA